MPRSERYRKLLTLADAWRYLLWDYRGCAPFLADYLGVWALALNNWPQARACPRRLIQMPGLQCGLPHSLRQGAQHHG